MPATAIRHVHIAPEASDCAVGRCAMRQRLAETVERRGNAVVERDRSIRRDGETVLWNAVERDCLVVDAEIKRHGCVIAVVAVGHKGVTEIGNTVVSEVDVRQRNSRRNDEVVQIGGS